jgi:excisionase family DNA binding protein
MQVIIITKEELEEIVKTSTAKSIKEHYIELNSLKDKPKTCTVPEAGKRLMVSDQTVRSYIKRGLIKAEKIGRRILIDTASIEKALSEVKSLKYKR